MFTCGEPGPLPLVALYVYHKHKGVSCLKFSYFFITLSTDNMHSISNMHSTNTICILYLINILKIKCI